MSYCAAQRSTGVVSPLIDLLMSPRGQIKLVLREIAETDVLKFQGQLEAIDADIPRQKAAMQSLRDEAQAIKEGI